MRAKPVKRVPGQHGVTPRGATRQARREGMSFGFKLWLWRLSWVLAGVVLLGGGYYGLSGPVREWLDRPVSEVSVEGTFQYLSRERVQTLLADQLTEDFLQLDLSEIKAVLEQEPWIERAALRRRWPGHLHVRITEQEPIARWGSSGFLNRRGDIIEVDKSQALTHLPQLEGADQDAAQMMERYQDLAQLLRSRGLTIQSLRSDDKGAWSIELSDGVIMKVGRDRVLEKVQRFTSVFDQQLSERWEEVEKVDLRYQSGVAVSWNTNQGNVRTMQDNEQQANDGKQ